MCLPHRFAKSPDFELSIAPCPLCKVSRPWALHRPMRLPYLDPVQKKAPTIYMISAFKKRRRPTLPLGVAVPSAQTGLTSLFGMVRGGPRRHGHLKLAPWPPKGGPKEYLKALPYSTPIWEGRRGFDIIMGQGGRIGRTWIRQSTRKRCI